MGVFKEATSKENIMTYECFEDLPV